MQSWLSKIVPSCISDPQDEAYGNRVSKPARRLLLLKYEAERTASGHFTRQNPRPLDVKPLPWKPRDSYKEIRELNAGPQARTCLTKSTGSSRVFVVKHVSSLKNNKCTYNSSYKPIPLEAWLLMEAIRPHPNIVQMFGCDVLAFRSKKMYFEYCTGGDLIDQIDVFACQKMYAPEAFVLHVIIELASALAFIHHGYRWDASEKTYTRDPNAISIIHGDVKADNVFLDWSKNTVHPTLPRVVLGDFGMAQPEATFEGISGTHSYQAPEIARIHDLKHTDRDEYNRLCESTNVMTTATDVYSFGIVMHMVATLKTHKVGADPYADGYMEGKARVGVRLPSQYFTAGIKKAIQRCRAVEPGRRPEMRARWLDPLPPWGFLDTVEEFRVARARLLKYRAAIPPTVWASKPGMNV